MGGTTWRLDFSHNTDYFPFTAINWLYPSHYARTLALARMLKILIWLCAGAFLIQTVTSVRNYSYCRRKCPLFDPASGEVLLPGPQKNQFYKCNFGVGILFQCGAGTYFNPKKKVCDWPWRARAVVCRGSPNHEGEGSGDDGFYF